MVDIPDFDVEPTHLALAGAGVVGVWWLANQGGAGNNELPPGHTPPNNALIGESMPEQAYDSQAHVDIWVGQTANSEVSFAFRAPNGNIAIPAGSPKSDQAWIMPSQDVAGGTSNGLYRRFIFSRQASVERFEYSGPVEVRVDGEVVDPNNPGAW